MISGLFYRVIYQLMFYGFWIASNVGGFFFENVTADSDVLPQAFRNLTTSSME